MVELGIFHHWQSSNLPKLEPNLLRFGESHGFVRLNADVRIKRRAGPIQTFPEPSFVFNFNFWFLKVLGLGRGASSGPI